MNEFIETILPMAGDLGATAIVFALLAYSYKLSKFAHERTLLRDAAMSEALDKISKALGDCLAEKTN